MPCAIFDLAGKIFESKTALQPRVRGPRELAANILPLAPLLLYAPRRAENCL